MAYDKLRRCIAELGADQTLESIPSFDSLRWIELPSASPPVGMVLGTVGRRNILAYMFKNDKSQKLRYCFAPIDCVDLRSSMEAILRDQIPHLSLDAPFKYIVLARNSARKISLIVQWYFLAKGLIKGPFKNYDTYSRRLVPAMRAIEDGQLAYEQLSQGGHWDIGANSNSAHAPRSVSRMSSQDEQEMDPPPCPEIVLEEEPTSSHEEEEEECQLFVELQDYLNSNDALLLLLNIPRAEEVQFVDQHFLPQALPKKLFVGHTKKGHEEIYALMRSGGRSHEINYYIEDSQAHHRPIGVEQVVKQHIYHPFNKTFPADGSGTTRSDKARLNLIIKWYFLDKGIVRNVLLRQIKGFSERLRFALEYIAKRMDDMRSSMSNDARCRSKSTSPVPDSSCIVQDETQPKTGSAKRTAEDADFEALAHMVAQDRDLVKKINLADEQLEKLDIQRQVFEDKIKIKRDQFMQHWEQQKQELLKRRLGWDEDKSRMRERFMRRSSNMADMVDIRRE